MSETRHSGPNGPAAHPFRPVADWRRYAPRSGGRDLCTADYAAVFERLHRGLAHYEAWLRTDRRQASELLAELVALPADQRPAHVDSSPRFCSISLVHELIGYSFELGFSEPAASLDWGELAVDLAGRLARENPGDPLLHDLHARAWAQVGNARRILSDLRGAEEAFALAETCLANGAGDPLEWARLFTLEAALRRYQRRPAAAKKLLRRALDLYRAVADRHREGRTLLSLAMVEAAEGEPERAIATLTEACELIDVAEEPRLAFIAQANLTNHLADCGRHDEAQVALARARVLLDGDDEAMQQLRLAWLEGKIATGLGQLERAGELLARAQQGFVRQGIGYTTAIVSLDLALVYARQGRTAEMKRLAAQMLPIFRSREIRREAMAALVLFCDAVAAEQATVGLVEQVRDRLRRELTAETASARAPG